MSPAQGSLDPLQADDPWHRWTGATQMAGDPGALFADLPEREASAFNGGVASFQGFAATPVEGAQGSTSSTTPVGGAVPEGDPMGGWSGYGRGQPMVGPNGFGFGGATGRPPRPVFSYGGCGPPGNFGNGYGMMNNGQMGPGSFYGVPHQGCGGYGGLPPQVPLGPGVFGGNPFGQAHVPGQYHPGLQGQCPQGVPGYFNQGGGFQHGNVQQPTPPQTSPTPGFGFGSPNGSPTHEQSGSQPAPSQAGTGPQVASAAAFDSMLGGSQSPKTTAGMTSAFEALGKSKPPEANVPELSQQDTMRQLINALSGEKKSMPSWGGSPSTLRSWLRSLAFWEQDNTTPKHRWGWV